MKNIANIFDSINKYTGYLCAFLVVLMTVNVFIVVFLRYLFGISFIWLQETYVWMHAYIFMAGAGFTYLNENKTMLHNNIFLHHLEVLSCFLL